jgi:hypothetical protein
LPTNSYSKKEATVETPTYGPELVAAQICVEQVIDVRNTLRYLSVPIRDKSFMFGDNKFVVDSSMHLNTNLHKRHTIFSFHRVREAIAASIVTFHCLSGDDNPADILSKHWGYTQIKGRLKALLFWKGDTADIKEGEATFQAKGECQVFSASIAWYSRRFTERHFDRKNPTEGFVHMMTLVERAGDTGSTCST